MLLNRAQLKTPVHVIQLVLRLRCKIGMSISYYHSQFKNQPVGQEPK